MNNEKLYNTICLFCLLLCIANSSVAIDRHEIKQYDSLITEDYMKPLWGRQFSHAFLDYVQNQTAVNNDVASEALCLKQFMELSRGLLNGSMWAFQFLDSWGGLPSGMIYGNLYDLGNYDECVHLAEGHLQGKYCLAKIPIGKISNNLPSFKTAICVPALCDAAFMDTIFKKFWSITFNKKIDANITLIQEGSCTFYTNQSLSGLAVTTLVLFGCLCAFVVLGTTCDYLLPEHYKDSHQLLIAFSLRTNARQLFSLVSHRKNPNIIPCLNGIRCLSLIWVIFSHDFIMLLQSPIVNNFDILDWIQTPFSMFLTQGFFSVDTFFFLSALLLTIMGLREMDKCSGKLNIPLIYFHRFMRLTPLLGCAILVYTSAQYLGDGPLWSNASKKDYNTCKDHWWATLLYIQNYAYPQEMCLGFSWYLAVDMQLYLITPLLLIALWKWHKKALYGIGLLLIVLCACLFTTIMINDYSMFYKDYKLIATGMQHIYFPTHLRASPWLIGIVLGYFLFKTYDQTIILSKKQTILGWLTSFSLMLTCIFSLLPKGQLNAAPLSTFEEATFISLTHIAWPLALSWIVFACFHGYGGPINSFLGHVLWQPLTRLSYSMYMFHMLIIQMNNSRTRTSTHFGSYDLTLHFWPDYGYTILLSVFMYLVIEAPLAVLEKTARELVRPSRQSLEFDPLIVVSTDLVSNET